MYVFSRCHIFVFAQSVSAAWNLLSLPASKNLCPHYVSVDIFYQCVFSWDPPYRLLNFAVVPVTLLLSKLEPTVSLPLGRELLKDKSPCLHPLCSLCCVQYLALVGDPINAL